MTSTALFRATVAAALMFLAAAAAYWMTPRQPMADARPVWTLSSAIPAHFADWRMDESSAGGVINPAQDEAMRRIYSEILTRTYVNSKGARVMLSVTYGRDQRGDRAVHYPEVCYPAQGFQVRSNRVDSIPLGGEALAVRRLETQLNDRRPEPVTYWTTIGEFNSLGGFGKRLIELRYGVQGVIPDGVLFRVSSIGANSEAEFARQATFIESLLQATRPDQRRWLTGRPAG